MELWIRSQDRMNLIEVHQVSLNYAKNTQIIANYKPEYFDGGGEYYELLGVYSSRERALEVLDEINCHMPTNVRATVDFVYEMPKE